MFTGLIEEIGEITAIDTLEGAIRVTVRGPKVVSDAQHGDSIQVSGVCLTVVEQTANTFTADVMQQTLDVTTLGELQLGSKVNLERAARADTRLGGHIVQGHVDGVATLSEIKPAENWRVLRFNIDRDLAPMLVDKGSITVAGVSLTVS
ncbi:MAG TPA: riboflavin synthase, partial [Microbacteriaceae bacterium]|nr:riboflavin synthase [Microbacteriaceae bacterium]